MKILITGGAGFIGSALIRRLIAETAHSAVNVDKLTYAANLDALGAARNDPRHVLERADITDASVLTRIFQTHQPDAVMHLAAESHVDRSIDGPAEFIQTNVVGTFRLLESALAYYRALRRRSSMTRVFGSPKTPRTQDRGRNPGKLYASFRRRRVRDFLITQSCQLFCRLESPETHVLQGV